MAVLLAAIAVYAAGTLVHDIIREVEGRHWSLAVLVFGTCLLCFVAVVAGRASVRSWRLSHADSN